MVKNIDNITQLPQTGATTMAVMLVGAFAIILVATASGFAAYRVPPREPGRRSGHRLIFRIVPGLESEGPGIQEPGSCGLFSCQPHDPALFQKIRNSHMNHKG